MAQGVTSPLFALDLVFDDQRPQTVLESNGCILGAPGRGTTHSGQHACQHSPLHVVERVVLGAIAIVNKAFFLACNALQDTVLKQGSADSDEVMELPPYDRTRSIRN